ncbi:MAG: DUF962 domain-containing protein [Labilithrix sp.]|nr:DUF962 domain-containing protein [Labilithrix sp.]MCW5810703.1 DUF962 domain-containing protein [Labilithrix sp.]
MSTDPYAVSTFEEFWPRYEEMHSRRATRIGHAVATASFLGLATAGVLLRQPLLFVAAPLADHAIAQLSHRLFERNATRPWRSPMWHARAELRLFRRTLRTALPTRSRRGSGAF